MEHHGVWGTDVELITLAQDSHLSTPTQLETLDGKSSSWVSLMAHPRMPMQ